MGGSVQWVFVDEYAACCPPQQALAVKSQASREPGAYSSVVQRPSTMAGMLAIPSSTMLSTSTSV